MAPSTVQTRRTHNNVIAYHSNRATLRPTSSSSNSDGTSTTTTTTTTNTNTNTNSNSNTASFDRIPINVGTIITRESTIAAIRNLQAADSSLTFATMPNSLIQFGTAGIVATSGSGRSTNTNANSNSTNTTSTSTAAALYVHRGGGIGGVAPSFSSSSSVPNNNSTSSSSSTSSLHRTMTVHARSGSPAASRSNRQNDPSFHTFGRSQNQNHQGNASFSSVRTLSGLSASATVNLRGRSVIHVAGGITSTTSSSSSNNALAGRSGTLNGGANANIANSGSSTVAQAGGVSLLHGSSPAIHPQFRSKAVCQLTCAACTAIVCSRGMKAILLADTRVELYSTDTPPIGVQLVHDDYMTRNCRCRIRDVACLGCGSVVGYHVTMPCNTCLDACNNGHFWMFHAEGIHSMDRLDECGTKPLLWAAIPCADKDRDTFGKVKEFLCR